MTSFELNAPSFFYSSYLKNYSISNSKVSTILTFILSSDRGVWMNWNLQKAHYSYNHPIGTHNLLWYADNSGPLLNHLVGPVSNQRIPLDQNFAPRPILLPEMKEQTETYGSIFFLCFLLISLVRIWVGEPDCIIF